MKVWMALPFVLRPSSQFVTHQLRYNRLLYPHKFSYSSPRELQMMEMQSENEIEIPLYQVEGLFSVVKPINWTSQDVVYYIRKVFERDAQARGVSKLRKKRNRPLIKVGHGGTLDPLATGVLVIGVGIGTKKLQNYLQGSKKYVAQAKFGIQTTTLDLDGEIEKTASYNHIDTKSLQDSLRLFRGSIQQVPPMYSALKKDGKKLYELAREGKTIQIEPRQVEIYNLTLSSSEENNLPYFNIEVECGGGTYIRSLIRDIAIKLDSVATMTSLTRTKQGPFLLQNSLKKENWHISNFVSAIQHTAILNSN